MQLFGCAIFFSKQNNCQLLFNVVINLHCAY